MPASYELVSLKGITKQSWLVPDEHERLKVILKQWNKENLKATIPQITLIELIVRNHLLIQRLFNRKYFLDGSKVTSYSVLEGRKVSEIDEEDEKRKAREFERWYQPLMTIETKLLQLALANSIEVNVVNDLSSLFGAMDSNELQSLRKIKGNGETEATRTYSR